MTRPELGTVIPCRNGTTLTTWQDDAGTWWLHARDTHTGQHIAKFMLGSEPLARKFLAGRVANCGGAVETATR